MAHQLTATPSAGAEGRSVLLTMAVQGHASSQYLLGIMHLEGSEVPLDRAEAIKWLSRAAAQRHEGAHTHLAGMAEHGDVAAHLALGLIARDIAGNSMAAARHLRAAAAAGNPQGLLALGALYSTGSAVERDGAEATGLFRSAAEAAMTAVLDARQGATAGILGPGSGGWLDEAVLRTRSADASSPGDDSSRPELFARYWVGLMLLAGAGTAADAPRGLAHHRTAAERGFALAEFSLGLLYERGHGVPRNPELARQWFARAAEHGHPLAAARASAAERM
ncbi:MAG: tetratricopeptide repeat protein [Rhodospirillales bacterium]|nr:tetratricopeptide repeat protein [Rhodospirillales bacterium]